MVDVLKDSTIEAEKRAGVQIVRPAVTGLKESAVPTSIMGFVGYALGTAEAMLIEPRTIRPIGAGQPGPIGTCYTMEANPLSLRKKITGFR